MVKKCTILSMNQIRKEGIPPKLEALLKIRVGYLNHDNIELFRKVNTQTTKIIKDTASKLRYIFNGKLPWSPEWKKAQNTKSL